MILFRTKKASFKCFHQEFRGEELSNPLDRGVMPVEIDKIVGSVWRCMDFLEGFGPKKYLQVLDSRLKKMKESMKKRRFFPVIEVYKVRDEYYVCDGHHRVVVAKELGRLAVDAHVIEYLPMGENPEDVLYREKVCFEMRTKLEGLRTSKKDLYHILLREIERYHKKLQYKDKGILFQEAARVWYSQIFTPAIRDITESGILRFFKDLTPEDFYAYLQNNRELYLRKNDKDFMSESLKTTNLQKIANELRLLVEKDTYLNSEESRRKFVQILPPCFYLYFCPYYPNEEKFTFIERSKKCYSQIWNFIKQTLS